MAMITSTSSLTPRIASMVLVQVLGRAPPPPHRDPTSNNNTSKSLDLSEHDVRGTMASKHKMRYGNFFDVSRYKASWFRQVTPDTSSWAGFSAWHVEVLKSLE